MEKAEPKVDKSKKLLDIFEVKKNRGQKGRALVASLY
jgi:hypothetical protein